MLASALDSIDFSYGEGEGRPEKKIRTIIDAARSNGVKIVMSPAFCKHLLIYCAAHHNRLDIELISESLLTIDFPLLVDIEEIPITFCKYYTYDRRHFQKYGDKCPCFQLMCKVCRIMRAQNKFFDNVLRAAMMGKDGQNNGYGLTQYKLISYILSLKPSIEKPKVFLSLFKDDYCTTSGALYDLCAYVAHVLSKNTNKIEQSHSFVNALFSQQHGAVDYFLKNGGEILDIYKVLQQSHKSNKDNVLALLLAHGYYLFYRNYFDYYFISVPFEYRLITWFRGSATLDEFEVLAKCTKPFLKNKIDVIEETWKTDALNRRAGFQNPYALYTALFLYAARYGLYKQGSELLKRENLKDVLPYIFYPYTKDFVYTCMLLFPQSVFVAKIKECTDCQQIGELGARVKFCEQLYHLTRYHVSADIIITHAV